MQWIAIQTVMFRLKCNGLLSKLLCSDSNAMDCYPNCYVQTQMQWIAIQPFDSNAVYCYPNCYVNSNAMYCYPNLRCLICKVLLSKLLIQKQCIAIQTVVDSNAMYCYPNCYVDSNAMNCYPNCYVDSNAMYCYPNC